MGNNLMQSMTSRVPPPLKYRFCAGVLKIFREVLTSAADFTDRKCQTIPYVLTPDGLQKRVTSTYIILRHAFRAQELK
jgi:hypothetical protein